MTCENKRAVPMIKRKETVLNHSPDNARLLTKNWTPSGITRVDKPKKTA